MLGVNLYCWLSVPRVLELLDIKVMDSRFWGGPLVLRLVQASVTL